MRWISLPCVLLVTAPLGVGAMAFVPPYVYVQIGPDSTKELERGLSDVNWSYQFAIWPREEMLASGIPADRLPKDYVADVKSRLDGVVNARVKPAQIDTKDWVGLKGLRNDHDCILGKLTSADGKYRLRFIMEEYDANITFEGPDLLAGEPADMTGEKACAAAAALLAIPQDKVAELKGSGTLKEIAGVPVYYGIIRDNWVYGKSPRQEHK